MFPTRQQAAENISNAATPILHLKSPVLGYLPVSITS
jgi:hypothetical protein